MRALELPASQPCPAWSIMIPTYNRTRYLETALRSVLQADQGPQRMQIEVVDNSSNGDVRQLISGLGSGRIQLHSVAERMPVTAAMTLCIHRAVGQWVHILHDDDYVHPGFYEKVGQAFARRPDVGAVLCRHEFVDDHDRLISLSLLEQEDEGVLERWLDRIAVNNRAQFPAIVVRRDVYLTVGAFDARLEHAADWDMWKRIAARFPVWYIPQVLASYRVHSQSDTSRLVRTAANIVDLRKAIYLSGEYLPAADAARLKRQALRNCARQAALSGGHLLKRGDWSAAFAQIREGWKSYPSAWYLLKLMLVLAQP